MAVVRLILDRHLSRYHHIFLLVDLFTAITEYHPHYAHKLGFYCSAVVLQHHSKMLCVIRLLLLVILVFQGHIWSTVFYKTFSLATLP